ncbi:putative nuclease HARBI1 [Heterodontus francisci]|uniref:putative nuclease HARBI1 n=1 Tax=Heterodontus francisci TaxID=7792 RepID=UPI00355B600E
MTRETVTHLCALLNDDLQPMSFGGHPMPVTHKMTVVLNFYASESFQRSTGDICGISQSAAHCCTKEMTDALFRRVQGITDCTHVANKAPPNQPAAFINRKGFHSIKVQLVYNYRKHFLQVSACFPGSCDDLYILHQSQVPLLFTSPTDLQGSILGDKGYPLMTWFLTPVRNPSNDAEEDYSTCHNSTRVTIEQAIGMLKMHFHCLDRSGAALQYTSDRIGLIVVVCCVLHNIAVQRGKVLQAEELRE